MDAFPYIAFVGTGISLGHLLDCWDIVTIGLQYCSAKTLVRNVELWLHRVKLS